LALRSHQNLARSYEEGWQGDLITPFHDLERDNNLRANSTIDKLATLKPVFGGPEGTMTAANSTPLIDGASAVLLASEEWAEQRGLQVQAYFTHSEVAAVDFVGKKDGLLMAPTYAVPRLLSTIGLTLQ